MWRDIQEGSLRGGDYGEGSGRGFNGESGSRTTAAAANAGVGVVRDALAAGVSSVGKSSSGLKGLKTSLLKEDGDTIPPKTLASDAGASPAAGNKTRGLWDEAAAGDLAALAAALTPGGEGDVHACNGDGWTALHSAAHAGHGLAVISLLVGSGASPASIARRGYTPLHSACMRGRWHSAAALLALGADANVRADDQRTPLHFACEAGSPECVKELLQADASPNVSDQDARTPLHFACIDGSTECVRLLLSAGASHFPPDAWGRDPAAVARQLDRAGPLKLLEAAAAGGKGSSSSSRQKPGRRNKHGRGGSSAWAGRGGGGGGDASGGDADAAAAAVEGVDDEEAERVIGEGGQKGATAVVGNRWVVMNESGRMLERRSGKVVALFKSMVAAVDWANGLTLDREITSGSFQVAEVVPDMRKAFEKEVLFEITGGGTVSEEEEEEKQDPQWTRYRRQQAAARKGASGGGGDRHKRGAWTAAAQRRDEDEARAIVAATANRLREVQEEADMHRQKAASLERALEAVLKECDDLVKAAEAGGARDLDEVSATGEEEEEEQEEQEGCPVSTAAAAAVDAPSMLLGVDSLGAGSDASPPLLLLGEGDPSQQATGEAERSLLNLDGSDGEEEAHPTSPSPSAGAGAPACGESEPAEGTEGAESGGSEEGSSCGEDDEASDEEAQLDSSSEQSAAEPSTLLEVDDDAADGDSGDDDAASAPSLLPGVDDPDAAGSSEASASAPSLLLGVDDPDAAQASASAPSLLLGVDDQSRQQPSPQGEAGGAGSSLLDFGDDTGDQRSTTAAAANGTGGNDGGEDGGEAAVVERLAGWLTGLKIREPDASRYAGRLVADGFDSEEALRGVREEELLQYGMKKGHARLVVRLLEL
ncbi:unnamed protein product [Ectocarpus sp. 12 AP-2014]